MARKVRPRGEPVVLAEQVLVEDSRALIDVRASDIHVWEDPRANGVRIIVGAADALLRARGAIVRIDPPPDAEPALVQKFAEAFTQAGAVAVRVLPRRRGDVVPADVEVLPSGDAEEAELSLRQVVEKMVTEANFKHPAASAAVVARALSKVGL